ncbi:hypothetical protein E2C01_072170 [Portunus trituberculatus]|uniref:Uncharacterized protein n=1 Tax=Portunus trituberculatus TaxID=210409 RepID=A0A5B7IA06_PORTR|nr:hypothetical protein [Portunus trituberculatus]
MKAKSEETKSKAKKPPHAHSQPSKDFPGDYRGYETKGKEEKAEKEVGSSERVRLGSTKSHSFTFLNLLACLRPNINTSQLNPDRYYVCLWLLDTYSVRDGSAAAAASKGTGLAGMLYLCSFRDGTQSRP